MHVFEVDWWISGETIQVWYFDVRFLWNNCDGCNLNRKNYNEITCTPKLNF